MAARAVTSLRKDKTRVKSTPTDEEIRQRAYELYLERGGQPGTELDDWLRAEAELNQRREAELQA